MRHSRVGAMLRGLESWQNGSVCCQAWQPEFCPQYSHSRKTASNHKLSSVLKGHVWHVCNHIKTKLKSLGRLFWVFFVFVFLGFFCFCFFLGGGLPLSKHIPGSCFSGKSLRAPSHPSNPSLSLPQHLILCPYHSTLLSLHPSPSKWGLGWRLWRCGRVKRWKNRKKLRLGFVFNCSVAAISLSLSLLEA